MNARLKITGFAALLALPLGATAALTWTLRQDAAALRGSVAQLRAERAARATQLAVLEQRRTALERELVQLSEAKGEAGSPSRPGLKAASEVSDANAPGTQAGSDSRPHLDRAAILEALATIRANAAGVTSEPPARPREPAGPHGNVYFPELFADASYAQLYLDDVRFRDNARYAPFYAALSATLAPAEIERLRAMLLQRQLAGEEVEGILAVQAMQEKRPRDMSESMRLKSEVHRQFTAEIRQTFGETVMEQLTEFSAILAARQNFLERLELRLSYSRDPLAWEQTKQLSALLTEQRRAAVRNRAPPGGGSQISDEFITAAGSILRPAQVDALREIRAEIDGARISVPGGGSSVQIRSGGK